MKLHWGGRCFSYGPAGTSSRANKSSWVWLAAVDSLTSWDVSCPAGASTWDSIHTNCAHAKKGHVHASVTGDEHNITWGQHSWEAETCNTSTITATSSWHPQCPQYTPRSTGCFLQHSEGGGAGSALPVHVVPWIRQCLCDGTHSSPPHMLLLFLPSHWCCSSRFFQIISFLAPAFTNQDSAFPTQPFHLES